MTAWHEEQRSRNFLHSVTLSTTVLIRISTRSLSSTSWIESLPYICGFADLSRILFGYGFFVPYLPSLAHRLFGDESDVFSTEPSTSTSSEQVFFFLALSVCFAAISAVVSVGPSRVCIGFAVRHVLVGARDFFVVLFGASIECSSACGLWLPSGSRRIRSRSSRRQQRLLVSPRPKVDHGAAVHGHRQGSSGWYSGLFLVFAWSVIGSPPRHAMGTLS